MQQRNISIDILKGIGIVLVLVAHALGGVVRRRSLGVHQGAAAEEGLCERLKG